MPIRNLKWPSITLIRPCKIWPPFRSRKWHFLDKNFDIWLIMVETWLLGVHQNRLLQAAVLKSPKSCVWTIIGKIKVNPYKRHFSLYKVGFTEMFIKWACTKTLCYNKHKWGKYHMFSSGMWFLKPWKILSCGIGRLPLFYEYWCWQC